MTSWNFRHIEFLIDIAEDMRDVDKMSATKQRRFNELKEINFVRRSEDFEGKYAELTPKGKECLGALEDEFVRLHSYFATSTD